MVYTGTDLLSLMQEFGGPGVISHTLPDKMRIMLRSLKVSLCVDNHPPGEVRPNSNEICYICSHLQGTFYMIFLDILTPSGKTGNSDHPSPACDILFKHQNTKTFALSTEIGMKWSGGPFFPVIYRTKLLLLFFKT